MRDMAANLGGLLTGCYICERKSPKLVTRSLRRFGALLPLVRFAQPAEVRLRKTQAFFSAQNDRLIGCLVVCVRFREHQGAPLPVGFLCVKICSFSRDAQEVVPYKKILKFSVGAIHESPVFVHDMRLFFSRCRGRHPLQKKFKIFRRGELCSPALQTFSSISLPCARGGGCRRQTEGLWLSFNLFRLEPTPQSRQTVTAQ